jgi:hypothetical protein
MYSRRCPLNRVQKAGNPYCPPVQSPGSAISESARLAQSQCRTAWVTTQKGPVCPSEEPISRTARIEVVVPASGPMPYVEVGSIPASLTTQQAGTTVITNAYDPYNPATRFRQYFPPAPIPYECPERIPNNLPIPTSVCIPVTRYEGSLAEAKRDGVIS